MFAKMLVKVFGTMTCLAFVSIQAATQSPPTAPTAPALTYSCDSRGEITLHMPDNYKAVEVHQVVQSNCKINDTTQPGRNPHIIDCATQHPVLVAIEKEGHQDVIGGQTYHRYIVECLVPDAGVTRTVTAKLQTLAATATALSLNPMVPTFNLQMTITPPNPTRIGDQLTLTVAGAGGYYPVPLACSANPENDANTKIDLYKGMSVADDNLMEDFVIQRSQSTAKLYAFVFKGKENKPVTISCTIKICPNQYCLTTTTTTTTTTSTTAPAPTTANPGTGRKRRAVALAGNGVNVADRQGRSVDGHLEQQLDGHPTHTVTASFRVVSSSSGQDRASISFVLAVVALLCHLR